MAYSSYHGILWQDCQVYPQTPQPLRLSCVELTTAVENLADLCSRPQLEQHERLVLSLEPSPDDFDCALVILIASGQRLL
ncbi:MAG TPA: hypothetical protein IGP91_05755 [Thermosynechococcus sp. M46_R2017_013]|nr:hypothetical protein [Thermosynechococcus sp. M46_R2017_013]